MIPFFLFILGLIIGSFLNAVIYRLKTKEGIITERSKCPQCKHLLGFWDLFPILSFIFLKGRCHYCHKKISWQYPLVELATGIIFVVGYLVLGPPAFASEALRAGHRLWVMGLEYLAFLIFSGFLIIIFVYDLKHYLIPDKVSMPAFIVALVINLVLGHSLVNLLLACLLTSGFFLFQLVVSKGRWIGGGDIRLGLVMGAMLGWPKVLVALLLAYLIGSVIGLGMIIAKKKQWNSQVPFGTFLSVATLITLLFGEEIISWYLKTFAL